MEAPEPARSANKGTVSESILILINHQALEGDQWKGTFDIVDTCKFFVCSSFGSLRLGTFDIKEYTSFCLQQPAGHCAEENSERQAKLCGVITT